MTPKSIISILSTLEESSKLYEELYNYYSPDQLEKFAIHIEEVTKACLPAEVWHDIQWWLYDAPKDKKFIYIKKSKRAKEIKLDVNKKEDMANYIYSSHYKVKPNEKTK